MDIHVEGRPLPRDSSESTAVWYRLVSAEYFRAMAIPIKRGRVFEAREAAPAVIVSDATARRFWSDENVIGRRVRFGGADAPWFTVVGVSGDVRMRGARGDSRSEVYLPYWQFPEAGTNVILKSSGRPESLIAPLRQAVRDVDPNLPASNVATMSSLVAGSIDEPRFVAVLAGTFAGLALVLAVVGIYGLVAFAVATRTAEIGVRVALGAERRDVFALVVRDGLKLTALGVGLGLLAAAGVGVGIKSLLFGIEPFDSVTFAGMTAALVVASLLACLLPAHRATRVDPMVALRTE
jgi:predicted permease